MLRFSPCKVNIGLDIVSRRPDGYHDIATAMVPVPWHDIIEIIPSKGTETTLTVYGNSIACEPEDNLVMKAYRTMAAAYRLPPVDIYLQKAIPDGAGLGGGSADAATTIRMLNQLFSLCLGKTKMAEIAASLGSDCPFFIYDRPMLCTGRGDVMEPVDVPLHGYSMVLVKPADVHINTSQAYEGVIPRTPEVPLRMALEHPVKCWQGTVKNDFEPNIFQLAPIERKLRDRLIQEGADYASLTGSGACVFGLYKKKVAAEKAQAKLTREGFLTFSCSF